MIFLHEMIKDLDIYEKRFCKALNKFYETSFKPKHGKGAQTKLAKKLNISQGYLSSILSGNKCLNSEEKRRYVADIIGLKYEEMIGIQNHINDNERHEISMASESEPIYIGQNHSHPDEKNLLEMTRKILSSDTEYAESLAANIRSFHHAVENKALIKGLISRVENLEEQIKSDRRKRERRQSNESYDGIERRFGPDRRKRNL